MKKIEVDSHEAESQKLKTKTFICQKVGEMNKEMMLDQMENRRAGSVFLQTAPRKGMLFQKAPRLKREIQNLTLNSCDSLNLTTNS